LYSYEKMDGGNGSKCFLKVIFNDEPKLEKAGT
jgi:hypothetical protein